MNPDFDRFYVLDTIERKDVDRLVDVWYKSAFMDQEGKEYHELITDAIPRLADWHEIPFVFNPESKHNFRDFVLLYDKTLLEKECDFSNPDECALYFSEKRNWRGVRHAVEKGAQNLIDVLEKAAEKDDVELIRSLWSLILDRRKGFYLRNVLRRLADKSVRNGQKQVFMFLDEEARERNLEKEFKHDVIKIAIDRGQIEVADYLTDDLSEALFNFGTVLWRAALNDNWDLVHLFMKKINEDEAKHSQDAAAASRRAFFLTSGFQGAIEAGDLKMVKFFAKQGVNSKKSMNYGLSRAAYHGYLNLIDYLVANGADDFEEALSEARRADNNAATVAYIKRRMTPEQKEKIRLAKEEKRLAKEEEERLARERRRALYEKRRQELPPSRERDAEGRGVVSGDRSRGRGVPNRGGRGRGGSLNTDGL